MISYVEPRHVVDPNDCFFYHSIDLPGLGPVEGHWDLRGRFADYTAAADMRGKRVLDVGAATGFLSFSAEQAGASVVSFDLDTAQRQHLLPFKDSLYVTDHAAWVRHQTAAFETWKNGYWLAHRLLKSKARVFYGDVYAIPQDLGVFDIVILGSILEHLADPIRALASVARVAGSQIVINTDLVEDDGPIARFNGDPSRPDNSYVFWTYSLEVYRRVLRMLGFGIVRVERHMFSARREPGDWIETPRFAILAARDAL